jgi:hypothetical protein
VVGAEIEQGREKQKKKKKQQKKQKLPPNPPTRKEKTRAHHWLDEISIFQNCLPPFLA